MISFSQKALLDKTWSATEIKTSFPKAKTLLDLIESTSEEARQGGSIVCGITVNGMNLSESDESRFASNDVSEISEFTIKVQGLEDLLVESRGGCIAFLSQLIVSIEKAALLFRTQDLIAAHRFYGICIEGTQLFVEMMAHYKMAFKNTKGVTPFNGNFLEDCLIDSLSQILEAYRQRDYSLVADLLEYELSSKLNLWQEELGLPVHEKLKQESDETELVLPSESIIC
jgi:hypothetical protein